MVSRKAFVVLLVLVLFAFGNLAAQWEASLDSLLQEIAECQPPVANTDPCSFITSRAIKAVYGISDFEITGQSNWFMSASGIINFVSESADWTDLGNANNQEALSKAQEAANAGKATLAILMEKPQGHVVVILPGKLTPSGKWGVSVPNSASFFLNVPKLSYVGKPLSYAFKESANVEIFSRNK